MSDTIPEFKVAAQAIVKRLPPSTCNGVRAEIEARVEAQLNFYLRPLIDRTRVEALEKMAGVAFDAEIMQARQDIDMPNPSWKEVKVWLRNYAHPATMGADTEAKAKGNGS